MNAKFDKSVIKFLQHTHNIRDYIIFSNITPEEVENEISIAITNYIKSYKKEI